MDRTGSDFEGSDNFRTLLEDLTYSLSSTRRQSAAGRASALRNKALIESRPATYRERVLSNPEGLDSSIFVPQPASTSTPAAPKEKHITSARTPGAAAAPEGGDTSAADTSSEGQTSRKRKMSSEGEQHDDRRQRAKTDDNAALLSEIGLLIQGSEKRTVEKFDQKIGELATRIDGRLDAAERDAKKMGRSVKALKSDMLALQESTEAEAAALPALVSKIVDEKLAAAPAPGPGPRATPRPRRPRENDKTEKYWEARRSLKIWPVPAARGAAGIKAFLCTKLNMDTDRVDELQFSFKPLTSPREGDLANQMLVTFETIRERDEVKGLARNLASDKDSGLQLDPPRPLAEPLLDLSSPGLQPEKDEPHSQEEHQIL